MQSRTRPTSERAAAVCRVAAASLRDKLATPCNQADMPVYVLLLFLLALGSAIVGFGGVVAPLASEAARPVFVVAVSAALLGLLRSAPH